jgi:hypothetical protein
VNGDFRHFCEFFYKKNCKFEFLKSFYVRKSQKTQKIRQKNRKTMKKNAKNGQKWPKMAQNSNKKTHPASDSEKIGGPTILGGRISLFSLEKPPFSAEKRPFSAEKRRFSLEKRPFSPEKCRFWGENSPFWSSFANGSRKIGDSGVFSAVFYGKIGVKLV